MHQGHEGAAGGSFDRRPLHVDQHVEGADPKTYDQEGKADQGNRSQRYGYAHDSHRRGDDQERCGHATPTPEPVEYRCRGDKPGDGPDRHAGEEQADRSDADAEFCFDCREPRAPSGNGDPTETEGGHDRPSPPKQGGSINNDSYVGHVRATLRLLLVGILSHW